MLECEIVSKTFSGSCANVCNSTKNKTFITFRRALPTDPIDILAVTDICIIFPSKNERTPPSYMKIEKNLNKSILTSDIYICYKKTVCKQFMIAYKPEILDFYPKSENLESEAYFCLPKGATLEVWPQNTSEPRPIFSTFVLTSCSGINTYGAVLSFYEPFESDKLTENERNELIVTKDCKIRVSKAICLVSKWPFFDAFKKFLHYVYKQKDVERHIYHFMNDIPFPSIARPRIQIEFGTEKVVFTQPDELPIPICGGSYTTLLKTLKPEFCIQLLYCVLLEHKILLHSLRPAVLTSIAEICRNMIFPFNWSFPYIPLCPLNLLDITEAPSAIIVGWDSCYVSKTNLPRDATCFDLDTINVSFEEPRKEILYKTMPRKATKDLRNNLTKIFNEMSQTTSDSSESANKLKEKQIEIAIQEVFLRFMISLLSGYSQFLVPIMNGPTTSCTDVSDRFDVGGFLKSRDRSTRAFYTQLMKTQCFTHFIQQRSFVSDKDTNFVFFDECIERIKEENVKLLEYETVNEERTSIIPPMESDHPQTEKPIIFPASFDHELLPIDEPIKLVNLSSDDTEDICTPPSSPIAQRSRHEIKSAQKLARKDKDLRDIPELWAKCLLSNVYSLWFIHLPYYMNSLEKGQRDACLRMAFNYLLKMQSAKLINTDELCYRVMMQLCKSHMADLSLRILQEMKEHNIKPNAITYGYYNKSILESNSIGMTNHIVKRWRAIIYRIMIINVFTRRSHVDEYKNLRQQLQDTRISPGCSSDEDEKCIPLKKDSDASISIIDRSCEMSDRGYDSLSRDDAISISEQFSNEPFIKPPVKRLFQNELINLQDCQEDSISPLCQSPLIETEDISFKELDDIQAGVFKSNLRRACSLDTNDLIAETSEDYEPKEKLFVEYPKARQSMTLPPNSVTALNSTTPKLSMFRSAASAFANKFTEIKQSLTTTTPSGSMKSLTSSNEGNSSTSSVTDINQAGTKKAYFGNLLSMGGEFANSAEMRVALTSKWQLMKQSLKDNWIFTEESAHTDDELTDSDSDSGERKTSNIKGTLALSASMLSLKRNSFSMAVDVQISTLNRCSKCQSFLYDEQIMAGWTACDSNLNSTCLFCNTNFLPSMRIHIKDYRYNKRGEEKGEEDFNVLYTPKHSNIGDPISASTAKISHEEKSIIIEEEPSSGDISFDTETSTSLPVEIDEIVVHYLSPLVLRKHLENILFSDSNDCLLSSTFVDQHPIIYWNLIWYYTRISARSYLPGLLFRSQILSSQDKKPHASWTNLDERNVFLQTLWDDSTLHIGMGKPLYMLWDEQITSLKPMPEDDTAVISNTLGLPFDIMRPIVACIMKNSDTFSPIQTILEHRARRSYSQRVSKGLAHSIYREIMFLAFVALDRNNIDIDAFDMEYVQAFRRVSAREDRRLHVQDAPLQSSAAACRKVFKELTLIAYS